MPYWLTARAPALPMAAALPGVSGSPSTRSTVPAMSKPRSTAARQARTPDAGLVLSNAGRPAATCSANQAATRQAFIQRDVLGRRQRPARSVADGASGPGDQRMVPPGAAPGQRLLGEPARHRVAQFHVAEGALEFRQSRAGPGARARRDDRTADALPTDNARRRHPAHSGRGRAEFACRCCASLQTGQRCDGSPAGCRNRASRR